MPLLPNRLTLMQRIQDAARNGYTWYTFGEIPLEKWPDFEAKFAGKYETDLSKSLRCKRRKAGEAVSLLYGHYPPPYGLRPRVTWVLAVTDGRGRVHGSEKLHEFRRDRLTFDGYELVHDGVSWTWQMTRARVNYWRERIHAIAAIQPESRRIGQDSAGSFDMDIEQVMDALYNAPGFRLVRRQIGKLVAFAKAEWKRLRPNTGVLIRERTFLPYVQRLPNSKKKDT